ncbi:MAG: hypothetical protein WD601_06910 [Pseudohongiellaceae bacterium]
MRKGIHQETLSQSVTNADHVIWFRRPDIKWPMETYLIAANAIIEDDIERVIDTIVTSAGRGIGHVVIMSNTGFGGLQQRLLARLQ